MLRTAALAAAAILTVLFLPASAFTDGDPLEANQWNGSSLVAHEWGTFTSLSGSDGVVLEGLTHEETDLPDFVHDIRDHAGVTGCSPKMETPVIYFYSPDERRVRVRVEFPRGTITQWYPAATNVNHVGPMINGWPDDPTGRAITEHTKGFIRWGTRRDLTVLPRDARPGLPVVGDDDPWRFCREVGANTLRMCTINADRGPDSKQRSLSYEHEQCLFYRGLGDFRLPLDGRVHAESSDGDDYRVRLTLTNPTPGEPLAHLFVVWVEDGKSGFHYLPGLEGTRDLELTLPLRPLGPSTRDLAAEMARRLAETGLYGDEALAMVHTWQQGYFQDEGLRVLYVLPRAFVDRELPLEIEPGHGEPEAAWQVVRTFVGRTELLSKEREADLELAVRQLADSDATTRSRAQTALDRLGRFAVPYLHRVLATTDDAGVTRSAQGILDALTLRR